MIARSAPLAETPTWEEELRNAYRDPRLLLSDLGLEPAEAGLSDAAASRFAFRVPRPYVRRMRQGDVSDPLLRQVLPVTAEDAFIPGFSSDPVGDAAARRSSSLLHKYAGRALLMLSGACAVNCRYCFRREYPYEETLGRGHLEAALATIASDSSLEEVILSGGDPLLLSDAAIGRLVQRLAAIPHVRRLRVHSRVPVVIPARITAGLLAALTRTRLAPVMVLHLNHPAELDAEMTQAGHTLAAQGILTLNQSVLLAGVNDDLDVLCALSKRLFEARIQPYYLHLLDRVHGSAHFEVEEVRARALYSRLHGALPGYLVPRLVREEPGMSGKTLQLPAATIDAPMPARPARPLNVHPE